MHCPLRASPAPHSVLLHAWQANPLVVPAHVPTRNQSSGQTMLLQAWQANPLVVPVHVPTRNQSSGQTMLLHVSHLRPSVVPEQRLVWYCWLPSVLLHCGFVHSEHVPFLVEEDLARNLRGGVFARCSGQRQQKQDASLRHGVCRPTPVQKRPMWRRCSPSTRLQLQLCWESARQ